jgi:hypothetical protein
VLTLLDCGANGNGSGEDGIWRRIGPVHSTASIRGPAVAFPAQLLEDAFVAIVAADRYQARASAVARSRWNTALWLGVRRSPSLRRASHRSHLDTMASTEHVDRTGGACGAVGLVAVDAGGGARFP